MRNTHLHLSLAVGVVLLGAIAGAAPMLDPAIDDPDRPWSYFGKTTTLIGVPFMPDAIQVTFDGALFTRNAELCFFLGDPPRPFFDRQKHWMDGWIPVVQARDTQEGVRCDLEMFTAVPGDGDTTNTLQLVRARLTNTNATPARAVLTSAARGSGGDYRLGGSAIGPMTGFEMTGDALLRDGTLVYIFPPGGKREAVPGVAYEMAFAAHEHQVTARAEAGLVRYERELQPGETWDLVFRMPRVPLAAAETAKLAALRALEWDKELARCRAYWTDLVGTRTRMSLPERRLEDAYRAATAHVLLGTRTYASGRTQTDGLPYPMLFIICLWDYQMLYDSMGLRSFYEVNVPHLRSLQLDDGMFLDTSLTHGRRIMSSHGPALFSLTHHIVMTRDRVFAESVWPMIRKAIACMKSDHERDPKGLLRRSWPYDAEMIDGYYASHNYWGLAALRSAIRAARLIGEEQDARDWLAFHDSYAQAVNRAIDASVRPNGYLPTGFYDFVTGPAARSGFPEYSTDQDYDNLMTAWPTEALRADDPRVMATFADVRDLRYREGIMTYRNGQHLHQYATVKNTMQALAAGRDFEFLRDAYHILAHSGSTHESFENLIEPWTTRTPDAGCPPPHVWGCAKEALLVRSMVVMEYGGRGGLDMDQRELRLFSAIPAGWAKPGQTASVHNAQTEFGPIDASLTFREDGADLAVKSDFHTPPANIAMRVPSWAEFQGLEAEGGSVSNGWIRLRPETRSARLKWKPKEGQHDGAFQGLLMDYRRERGFWPGKRSEAPPMKEGFLTTEEKALAPEPLSFELVTRALTHEFRRRFAEYAAAGGKPWPVAAPVMLSKDERASLFKQAHGSAWDPAEMGIAVGKTATASATAGAYSPSRAVDGNATDLQSSWQADPYPQWWQVDLGKVESINRIHAFPYWGLGRSYKYTIDLSTDGKSWHRIADLSENTEPATPQGNDFRFQPVDARYVRVNMLHHSLNPGVHLVELRVFTSR
jgi:hypothetical protein